MPEPNTDYEPYFLADRIYDRAAFVAELLKFYPNVPSEQDMNGMWTILGDIAADAKKLMLAIDPAKAIIAKAKAEAQEA